MSNYIVIASGEDGVRVYQYNKQELEKALEEKAWGNAEILRSKPDGDPSYWNVGMNGATALLIIKGACVVPNVVYTTTRYELP